MANLDLLEPEHLYNYELKYKHHDNVVEYFTNLVKKAGTNKEANKATCTKYYEENDKLAQMRKELKKWNILKILFIFLCIVIAGIFLLIFVWKPRFKEISFRIAQQEELVNGYLEEANIQMASLNALFETDIPVLDNIQSDMMIQVDKTKCDMKSLITGGARAGSIYLDSKEAMFNIIVMMRDTSASTRLYDDPSFDGYVIANRFRNNHRDLTLYKPMSMMRNTIEFSGENDNYTVDVSMVPFLRYDIPLDEDKMNYFIQAFADQYKAMEPVTSKLDGNTYIDFKLYNTYGRSRNYYIGPMDGEPVLKNSTILLDNVYVTVKLIISVFDRSLYTQTVNEVINEISTTFSSLDSDDTDLHVSEIIHNIMANNPNVRYLRFLGFNNYDANKQSIFVKFSSISDLSEDNLMSRVPEIIRADSSSIEISEET